MKGIKFKLVNEKKVLIIGVSDEEEHEIGHIFTPSGSSEDVRNAIQVCGFTEAFDLWGCGVFKSPKTDRNGKFSLDDKGDLICEQVKDIQLKFDIETRAGHTHDGLKATEKAYVKYPEGIPIKGSRFKRTAYTMHTREIDICYRCYNHPCTCEVKVKYSSPYAVKRGSDLILLKKEKKKK